jgi:hypothetical protein
LSYNTPTHWIKAAEQWSHAITTPADPWRDMGVYREADEGR